MASNSTRAVPTGPIENVSNSPSSPRKLEDQAAAAALYATHPERSTKKGYEFLDSDNKLSSAGELLPELPRTRMVVADIFL